MAGRRNRLNLHELLNEDFVDDNHIGAFEAALASDDVVAERSPNGTAPPNSRPPRIVALSDFAPVNLRVKKRKKRQRHRSDRRSDYLYLLLRWPLLGLIFIFIAAEFGFYVVIRQLVNTKEWISAWRGQKGALRRNLRQSSTLEEWRKHASILDNYLHFDEWKRIDEDVFYDWKLVRKVKQSLQNMRENNDVRGVLGVLETCLRSNFAGVESPRLYSETFMGTKDLIEAYFDELECSLYFIRSSNDLSTDEKKRFYRSANINLGTSALCLSGASAHAFVVKGASFGYYHVGVVKAFVDAGLLPRVVTGTSAGGLIAALVCTRTDDELKILLVPELADRITACEEPFSVWAKRMWKTGARFDSVLWAKKCTWFTCGSMTFKEAYMKTGRILNISVIPASRHSPTKLLNYVTAPDTVIWSALLGSAAVPGILPPAVLMRKLKDGSLASWNWGSRFKDGSLRVDIPITSLNLYFNVTHPIVSQVNPHVHLFFFAPRGSAGKPVAHRKGKGWRGNFLLSAAEQWLKHELTKNFKIIRDLELLPQVLGQDWSSVFLQRPRTRLQDWFRLLTDPDRAELQRMIQVGQIVTFPKLHMIENRARIEKQIFLGRQSLKRTLQPKTGRVNSGTNLAQPLKASQESFPGPSSSTPVPTGSDAGGPPSLDTDVETTFALAHRHRRRRGSNDTMGSTQDPLRSPIVRKRWASELVRRGEFPEPSYAANPPPSPKVQPKSHGGIITRLRTTSFPSLPSPFRRSSDSHVDEGDDDPWSSDSSSSTDYYETEPTRAFATHSSDSDDAPLVTTDLTDVRT